MATLKNTTINDTGFLKLPNGNTAQRPGSPSAGMMRYNTDFKSVEYWDGTRWNGVTALGSSPSNAASSATMLSNAGITSNGPYWILINGVATEVYVNFSFAGGPYILVMVAASTGTTYDYDSSVWTNNSGGVSTALDPNFDTNQVSTAFYNLATTRTGLALYQNSTSYFQYLDHASGTPQALSTGSAGVPGSITPNGTTIAANNIIPSLSPARPLGWFDAITAAGYTAQSNGSTYYRYGWYHGIPNPTSFGYVRFGFSADLDSSDSRDRAIGIGIKNNGGGPVGLFTASAGRFDYTNGSSGPKNNLQGFLYVKN